MVFDYLFGMDAAMHQFYTKMFSGSDTHLLLCVINLLKRLYVLIARAFLGSQKEHWILNFVFRPPRPYSFEIPTMKISKPVQFFKHHCKQI